MQKASIVDILTRSIPREPEYRRYRMYLVRDGETIFYIGQAQDVYTRLEEHVGIDWKNDPSSLGRCVIDNMPSSQDWVVEFYTLAECQSLTGIPVTEYDEFRDDSSAVNDTEIEMIHLYRPCLNRAANPHPTILPDRYDHSDPINPFGKAMGNLLGFAADGSQDK